MARRRVKSSDFAILFLVVIFAIVRWVGEAVEYGTSHPLMTLAIVAAISVTCIKVLLPAWRKHEAEEQLKRVAVDWWVSQDGRSLEHETARLYSKLGYAVEHKGGAGDESVDLLLRARGGERLVVQCKAHARPIGPGVVRDLYGTVVHQGARAGVLVAPRGFTQAAKRWASGKPIQLLDAERLVELSNFAAPK